MSHAHEQMMERYGFVVSPQILLRVIHAGNAREKVSMGEGHEARMFDVPLTFEDGTQVVVRCLVSLNLDFVITVLPPERRLQQLWRKQGADAKRVHKTVARRLVDDVPEEGVTPVEEFEASTTVEQKPVCALSLADKLRAALHS
jgi:hypothetical protein